jgi:hypothetical protein
MVVSGVLGHAKHHDTSGTHDNSGERCAEGEAWAATPMRHAGRGFLALAWAWAKKGGRRAGSAMPPPVARKREARN